jgi:Cof subfamily protein (haloacid dehalogenase superfamily)
MTTQPKVIFFDIDWTLYDHQNHQWPFSALTALKELKAKGYKLIICTARPYHSFKLFGALDLGIDWDGYIASAGGVAYVDGVFVHKSLMASNDVKAFCALAGKEKLTLELVEVLTRKLVYPMTEDAQHFYEGYHESIPERGSFEGEEVIGLNFFAPASYDAEFTKAFPQLIYSRYFDYAVDVMGTPHLKGLAVDKILQHYGYHKDEAMGFGDDIQDISMAEHVGTFVCMGQGKAEVKAVASYVTDPVWDDGVAKALRHFRLI